MDSRPSLVGLSPVPTTRVEITETTMCPQDLAGSESGYSGNWKASKGFLWFLVLFVVFYIVLQTFNPSVVQTCGWKLDCCAPPDNAKCFVGGLIISLVLILILWLVGAC